MTLKIDIIRIIIGLFRMSSLLIFQSKGRNRELFHPRNILHLFTVKSDVDRKNKSVVSEKEKLEIQDITILAEVLVNQDSNSDAQDKIHYVEKQTACLK